MVRYNLGKRSAKRRAVLQKKCKICKGTVKPPVPAGRSRRCTVHFTWILHILYHSLLARLRRLQVILSKMTSSPLRGLLLGLAVTAVIQSSSATTVMVVGFVNSGLMDLYQTVGVIMGANIGTTVTAWLLSLTGLEGDSFLIQMLSPDAWAPLLGFAGIILFMAGKDKQKGSARSSWALPSSWPA